jgi:hypothetical protein
MNLNSKSVQENFMALLLHAIQLAIAQVAKGHNQTCNRLPKYNPLEAFNQRLCLSQLGAPDVREVYTNGGPVTEA